METTFLNSDRRFKFPVAKCKHQTIPSLTGHMIVFITDPLDERQVREANLQPTPGSLTTDYCNRL